MNVEIAIILPYRKRLYDLNGRKWENVATFKWALTPIRSKKDVFKYPDLFLTSF